MRPNVAVLPAALPLAGLTRWLEADGRTRRERLYPVVDAERRLLGVVRRGGLQRLPSQHGTEAGPPLAAVLRLEPVGAHPHAPPRGGASRMADTRLARAPRAPSGGGGARVRR